MYCADCEKLDNYFFSTTWFWLFFPTSESTAKAIAFLGQGGHEAAQKEEHCLVVKVQRNQTKTFLFGLFGELEPPELANTKITTTASEQTPSISDMGRIVSANVLVNRFNSSWLVDSIEQQRFETHFQSIVQLDTNGNTLAFGQEGLFRMRDENHIIVPPSHVFQLAEHADLLFSLDLVARRSAVSHYAKSKLQGKLFINFNPTSIYDPSYCLRATVSAIHSLGIKPENVVFEITETQKVTDESVMKGILNFYRNAGFKVALDDIGSGWSGLNMLHRFRPDYVKIDMDLVRNLHQDSYKQAIVKYLIQIAHENGIQVISEGIENREELAVLRELRSDYFQGFYFDRPHLHDFACSEQEQADIDRTLSGVK